MRQLGLFRPAPRTPTGRRPARSRRAVPVARGWQGPTLSEFVARVEGEFGDLRIARPAGRRAATTASGGAFRLASDCLGLAAWDRLDAESVRALCDQWGLPAEDFGLDS